MPLKKNFVYQRNGSLALLLSIHKTTIPPIHSGFAYFSGRSWRGKDGKRRIIIVDTYPAAWHSNICIEVRRNINSGTFHTMRIMWLKRSNGRESADVSL
jgi:hypothetical protein